VSLSHPFFKTGVGVGMSQELGEYGYNVTATAELIYNKKFIKGWKSRVRLFLISIPKRN